MATPVDPQRSAEEEAVGLRVYLDVLKRRKRIIAGVTLAAFAMSLALTLRQDKMYKASADILLNQRGSEASLGDSLSAYADSFNVDRRLTNEIQQLQAGATQDAVAAEYEGPLDPADVSAARTNSGSDVVRVSMSASDPDEAAKLVNTYIDVYIDLRRTDRITELAGTTEELQVQVDDLASRIEEIRAPLTEVEQRLANDPGDSALEARREALTSSLEPQLAPLESSRTLYQQQLENLRVTAGIVQLGGAKLLTPAEAPTSPVSPKPVQSGILALIVGGLFGVVVAFVRDSLDERIRGADDLTRAAPGIPPFAVVPEVKDFPRGFVAIRDEPTSVVAEAFRSLRTSIKFAGLDQEIRVIQVTSALPGEGKTTTAVNLAEAFAQGGERTVLVCCDLRRPRLHHAFGQTVTPGFTDVLLQDAPLASALRRMNDFLYILPAGSAPPNPSELLSTSRAYSVIMALAEEFDVVIIDSTPVLPVSDALVVSRMADATLLVVDTRTTKRGVLRQTVERLKQVSAPTVGMLLNGVTANSSYSYGYAYVYGYGDGPAADGAPTTARAGVSGGG